MLIKISDLYKDIEYTMEELGKALVWANNNGDIKAHCGYDACGENYVRLYQLVQQYRDSLKECV